jgi:hypothetical protein
LEINEIIKQIELSKNNIKNTEICLNNNQNNMKVYFDMHILQNEFNNLFEK